jgi:O-antigen ligase
MNYLMLFGLSFLALGVFTSVSILGISQILIAIPTIYFTFLMIKDKKFSIPSSSWCLLAFSLIAFISCVINHEFLVRVEKNYGSIKYPLIAIFTPFALCFFFKNNSDKIFKFLTSLFLFSIIVAGLYGLWKMEVQEMYRLKGFTDTMRYGYGTSMILTIIFGLVLRFKEFEKWINKWLLFLAMIVGLVALYYTKTRGAAVALLFSYFFVLLLKKKKWSYILSGIFLLTFSLMVGNYFFGKGDSTNRFMKNNNNRSDNMRKSQWLSAVEAIKERPLIGWGPSNFHSQVKRIKEKHGFDFQGYNDSHSHNIILETWAGTGLFGLIALLGWLLFWIKEVWTGDQKWKVLMIPFFMNLMIGSQFELITDANNSSMIYFLYSLSVYFNMKKNDQPLKQSLAS